MIVGPGTVLSSALQVGSYLSTIALGGAVGGALAFHFCLTRFNMLFRRAASGVRWPPALATAFLSSLD